MQRAGSLLMLTEARGDACEKKNNIDGLHKQEKVYERFQGKPFIYLFQALSLTLQTLSRNCCEIRH